ncbi:MAG: ABC transporter permease [Bacteroidales bacterium]|nr:ABC transporter permease [Bacteroidales bacterium]
MKRLLKIIHRELTLWARRPIYLLGSAGVMALSALFFLTFFGEGIPQDLPIGVVDMDCSSTSRNFTRQLDATQLGEVVPFASLSEARREMETGRICAYVVVPEHFDADVQAFRCPKMGVYVNAMNPVIGGALSYKDILFMVNLTNGAVQREVLRAKGVPEREIMARIQPVVLDAHNIGNAPTSYAYYLNNMILAGILAMSVLLVVSYALASELKYGTSADLLEMAGDSIDVAVAGKLIPYTLLFTALGTILELLLFGPLHYPMNGSVWGMLLDVLLLVLASEAVSVFIVSMVPTLRLSVCISALYSVLGFSFAGFTLPIASLPAALRGFSCLYPLRFYYLIFVQEAVFGVGFAGWWPWAVVLLAFLLLPLFGRKRLYGAYKYLLYPRN